MNVPWHLILRYVDPALKQQNIEATGGGGYVSDDEYIQVFQISQRGIKSGAYLRTMTYREFLGDLIAQNGVYWSKRGDYDRGALYLEKAVNLNPHSADILRMLGFSHLELSKTVEGDLANQLREQANLFINTAQARGVTELSNDNYLEQQKKAQEKYRQEHKEE